MADERPVPAGAGAAPRVCPLMLSSPGARVLVAGTGVHDPPSRLPAIPAVPATLGDLGDRLVERAGLDPAALTRVVDPPDPRALSDALVRTAAEATSVVMFHYVGHGVVSPRNELHLATRATADLTRGVPAYQALPFSVVHEVLSQCRAELVVIVLDCCFAGRAHGVAHDSVGAVFDTAWSGAYLLTSSSRDESSWALPGERYTAFSGELIRLMDEGDPAGPPVLTLDHVYRSLVHALAEKGFPRPRRQATDLGDRSPFLMNPAYRAPAAPGAPEISPDGEESPYRGLAVFGPQDEDVFFGREELTRTLVRRVETRRRRGGPLLVTGPSGSGKSSVLQAGVIPALRRSSGGLCCAIFTPGADPLRELSRRIAALTDLDPDDLRTKLEADPLTLRRVVQACPSPPLILADQFEELFTVCRDESRRRVFVEALAGACRPGDRREEPPATVVIGIRADFFGYCASYPELLEALKHPEIVGPMTKAQLREVIERPAERYGLVLEEGLADLLLEDLRADDVGGPGLAGVLPLLSHALLSTWQRRSGRLLTMAAYRASGGISRSLSLSADETLGRLGPDAQAVAHQLLLRLVHLDDRTDDTRQRVALRNLLAGQEPVARDVLGAFVHARLVTVSEDSAELTHETLIHAWPRLRTWIDADRASLLVRQHLVADAEAWDEHGRDPAYLYPDSRLAAAQTAVRDAPDTEPTDLERRFLDASARRASRRRRTAAAVIATLTVLLLAAVSTGVLALVKRNEADRQRNEAVARQLVDTAQKVKDRSLAAYLSLAAYHLADLPETRGAVLASRSQPISARLFGHTRTVWDVAFSPDGRTLASVSADRTLRLWDTGGRPARQVFRHVGRDEMRGVAFSAGGGLLAVSSHDGAVTLWNPADPRSPRLLSSFRAGARPLNEIAFSPREPLLAVSSADGTATLWDVRDPSRPRLAGNLHGHAGEVRDVAFSPDGRWLATASSDRSVRLWDVADPGSPWPLWESRRRAKPLEAVAFSPDGGALVAGGGGNEVLKWDPRNLARPPIPLPLDGETPIHDLAFRPGSRILVGASIDNFAHIWDVSDKGGPRLLRSLQGHTNDCQAVAVNPRNGTIATGSADRTVRLWHVDTSGFVPPLPRLFGHGPGKDADHVALSPDRRTLASVSDDTTVHLSDVRDPRHPRPLPVHTGHTKAVTKASFSPDGRLLATASDDATVRLWDVRDPDRPSKALAVIRCGVDKASGVEFGADGRTLVIAVDERVEFWDVAGPRSPKPLLTLPNMPAQIRDLARSPDGRLLALAAADGNAYLYDIGTARRPVRTAVLSGHTGRLQAVTFGPDGRTLVTTATDGTARLWDVSDPLRPHPLARLIEPTEEVVDAAFSPDGRTLAAAGVGLLHLWDTTDRAHPRSRLVYPIGRGGLGLYGVVFLTPRTVVTAGQKGDVQMWNDDLGQALTHICQSAGTATITEEEWHRYLPGREYDPRCP
ncbi:caspase, EACC1-associated type [Microbispora sp. H10836]|uniref:caspase, EACC1-associated type n=1 Tax=Microbispora sp. H10836 TaxID=2729106 RepID=UPI00147409A6|nr:AAA family ATPase [Microbispora sp. H10836]